MAPKRKITESKSEPTAKRSTRGSTSTSTSASASTSKAIPKKAAPIAKKKKAIVISSDDEDSEGERNDEDSTDGENSEVEIVTPVVAKKKAAVVTKKVVAPKKVVATKKVITKGKSTPTSAPAPASTSTTPLPEISPSSSSASTAIINKPKPKVASPVKKILTWEESTKEWFGQFVDVEDESDLGTMVGEGVERFFDDLGVAMEGPLPFILAWKLGSKPGSFGSYYLSDFLNNSTFRSSKINSSSTLKAYLLPIEKNLFPQTESEKQISLIEYKKFYNFMFNFLKSDGQKSLVGEMAIAVWSVILANRFKIAEEFVEFATELGTGFKGVSMDVWSQLLEFCCNVDVNLVGFNEEDAWPAVIDEFVEWKKSKAVAAK